MDTISDLNDDERAAAQPFLLEIEEADRAIAQATERGLARKAIASEKLSALMRVMKRLPDSEKLETVTVDAVAGTITYTTGEKRK